MQQNKGDKLNAISMHDFLDFLKLTCEVHQSLTAKDDSPNGKIVIDYSKLAKNELVNSLLSAKAAAAQSPKTADSDNSGGGASNSSFERKGA